jgi:hypothetical protein
MDSMWLTTTQLAALLKVSEQAVRKSLGNNRYSSARYVESSRGGKGGKAWEISAYDPAIPESVRRELKLPETAASMAEDILKEGTRVSITPELIDGGEASARLRVLRRIGERPAGVKKLGWMRQVSAEEQISLATLYRWTSDAGRGKVTSDRAAVPVAVKAESGPIRIAVKSRSFPPQALEYGLSLLVNTPGRDVKNAYEELEMKAAEKGWEMGSLGSFYRAVRQLPQAVSILAHSGRRGLEAATKPPIRRDMTNVRVYDVLIGDQHIFDYVVLDDDGRPIRPQMFAWVDAKSRYFSGVWPVMGDYDKYAVGFALREACRYGLPRSLYNDWGKPEGSDYIAQLRRQLSGYSAFKDMGEDGAAGELPQRKARPRNAQAKAIESYFFHAIENPLLQRGLPGYARRDGDDKKNEFIQGKLREAIKGKKLLHVRNFLDIVLDVLESWHRHVMTEDKTVPEEVFAGGITHLPRLDDNTLDFICWPAAKRLVRNSLVSMTLPGFGKCEWYAPELSGFCRRGKKTHVEVRFNPYDASKVYVLDADTQKSICVAERWKATDPDDMDAVADKIRRQNQITKWWADAFKQLARPEVKIHQFSPYQGAAAEIVEMEKSRADKEEIVVDRCALNQKLISFSDKAPAVNAGSVKPNRIAREG